MRPRSFFLLVIVIALSSIAMAQDYGRLEKYADDVKDAAERVSKKTSDAFRKGGQNSTEIIEQAFLGEQVYAAARYLEKIISNKYDLGDIRLGANVLTELSEDFPSGDSDWSSLKDKISSLVFELGKDTRPDSPPVSNTVDTTASLPDVEEGRILGRFFWNGEVDAEVRLSASGTVIRSETVQGKKLEDGTYSFTSALPKEDGIIVRVKKDDGRGEATVIQQPNVANDYTAVIRIVDSDGGARPYSLQIYWYRAEDN